MECYHENIWPDQDAYYFFDEIQYASDWDKWMKTLYDMQPRTQMVATGSASPALIKGSTESGAGRWSIIQVPALSFFEYCALIGLEVPDLGPAVLMDDDILTNPIELGKMAETAVYKHVAAYYYQQAARVGYFRGGKKGKEIDIVADYPNARNILIEVKYRERAPIPGDDAICELCDESSAAIIVTKRADDYGVHNAPTGKEMIRIPAFAFLYLLGNAERYGYRGKE